MSKPTLEESLAALRPHVEPSARLTTRLARMAASVEPEEVRPESRPSYARLYLTLGSAVALLGGFAVVASRLGAPPPKPPPISPLVSRNAQTTLEEANRMYWQQTKKSRYIVIGSRVFARRPKRGIQLSGAEAQAARQAVAKEQRPVRALIKKALAEAFLAPHRDSYIVNNYSDSFSVYYTLATLLSASARAKSDAGDYPGALADVIDIVKLGYKVEKGAQVGGWAASNGAKIVGLQALGTLAPKLDAGSAKQTLALLETLDSRRVRRADTLEATRWAAYKTFQTRSWDQAMFDMGISYGPRSTLALRATPKSWIIAEHLRYLDSLKTDENAVAPLDAFNQFVANQSSAFKDEFWVRIAVGATEIALARQIWRGERKTEPPSLQALVEAGYLKGLPPDPFAPKQPLKLSANGTIYSVGPDGIDDGGAPQKYLNRKQKGDIPFPFDSDNF